jgi:hypothetical protein
MTFDDCCRVILTSSRTSPAAKAYAKAGLGMSDPHAVAIQARYILINITHWRHGDAPVVRDALKLIARSAGVIDCP